MQIDKSYILILIMDYLNKNAIKRISLENIDIFMEILKAEIFQEEEIDITINDDIEEKKEALTQCFSINENNVTVILQEKLPTIKNLWKLKQGNGFQEYLIFDSLFTTYIDSENIKDFLKDCQEEQKEEGKQIVNKTITFYNQLIKTYRNMYKAEVNEDINSYNKNFLLLQQQIKKRKTLLDDVAYNMTALIYFDNLRSKHNYPSIVCLNEPSATLSKLYIDLTQNLSILFSHIFSNITKEKFVIDKKAKVIDNKSFEQMINEVYEINFANALNEMIDTNKLKISKKELLYLKYIFIPSSTTYEKKFITNDYTLFQDLDYDIDTFNSYKNKIPYTVYKEEIISRIDLVMKKSNQEYKTEKDYCNALYCSAVIQACINTTENKDAFALFQNQMLILPNSDNPEYSISKYILTELVHQKENNPKEFKKVD